MVTPAAGLVDRPDTAKSVMDFCVATMTVEHALDLSPQLMATGMRLGSPAPAWGADLPDGWLDRFMNGARARSYRVAT